MPPTAIRGTFAGDLSLTMVLVCCWCEACFDAPNTKGIDRLFPWYGVAEAVNSKSEDVSWEKRELELPRSLDSPFPSFADTVKSSFLDRCGSSDGGSLVLKRLVHCCKSFVWSGESGRWGLNLGAFFESRLFRGVKAPLCSVS